MRYMHKSARARTHKHFKISYPETLRERFYSIWLMPLLTLLVLSWIVGYFAGSSVFASPVSVQNLLLALIFTLLRLVAAYTLAVLVALPLALLAVYNETTEKIFLPIFDILESIPVLAFFPVVLIVFVSFNFLNGAAVFILFLSMLWNLVFTLVGGLKMIPRDIHGAAQVFKLKGRLYLNDVILPSIFPQFVTGSILAAAQGWNLIIVAEVIHTYVPNASSSQDLFGLGSVLVQAVSAGQNGLFLAAVFVMVVAIALLNFFVWQKLIHYASRFKFE